MRRGIGAVLVGIELLTAQDVKADPERWKEAVVTVRVYDYVGLPISFVAQAQHLVSHFYSAIGVRMEWAAPRQRLAKGTTREQSGGTEDLTVIVLTRSMVFRPRIPDDAAGAAIVGPGSGSRIAYIFYSQVDAMATDAACETVDLLARVIAHELGHLLLPQGSHSAEGLMRGRWTVDELRRTRCRNLTYTDQQASLIRDTLRARAEP
jgi:hypothetical protein